MSWISVSGEIGKILSSSGSEADCSGSGSGAGQCMHPHNLGASSIRWPGSGGRETSTSRMDGGRSAHRAVYPAPAHTSHLTCSLGQIRKSFLKSGFLRTFHKRNCRILSVRFPETGWRAASLLSVLGVCVAQGREGEGQWAEALEHCQNC